MMPTIHIRPARVDDAASIARVHVDTWRTTYVGIVPDEHLAHLSYARAEERWREWLTAPARASCVLIAETDDAQIIGFVSGGTEHENDAVYQSELYNLYLLQEYQRRGIGRQLVTAAAQQLQQAGFVNLLVWVLADNPACAFYAALGGKPVREKTVNIGGKDLREVGYGWDRLDTLTV